MLRTGTEADHAIYFSRNGYLLDNAINFELTFAPKSASAARLGLTTLLRRKGRVLDAAAASMATIRIEAVARRQEAARRSRERAQHSSRSSTVAGPARDRRR